MNCNGGTIYGDDRKSNVSMDNKPIITCELNDIIYFSDYYKLFGYVYLLLSIK